MREKTVEKSDAFENAKNLILSENHPFFKELSEVSKKPWILWIEKNRLILEQHLEDHLKSYQSVALSLPYESQDIYWRVYRKSLDFIDEKLKEERKFDKYRNWMGAWYLLCVRRQLNLTPYLLKYRSEFQSVIPSFNLSLEEQINYDNIQDDSYFKIEEKWSYRARVQILFFTSIQNNPNIPKKILDSEELLKIYVAPLLNEKVDKINIENTRAVLAQMRSAQYNKEILLSAKVKKYLNQIGC